MCLILFLFTGTYYGIFSRNACCLCFIKQSLRKVNKLCYNLNSWLERAQLRWFPNSIILSGLKVRVTISSNLLTALPSSEFTKTYSTWQSHRSVLYHSYQLQTASTPGNDVCWTFESWDFHNKVSGIVYL